MRRPPFTMKTLENLESLTWLATQGLSHSRWIIRKGYVRTGISAEARAAIEWIAAMRRWKTEQNEKPIEIPVPPGNPSD